MLDKNKIIAIQADIRIALESVAAKHNLKLAKHYISYSTTDFKLAAEFGDKAEIGDTNPAYIKDLKRYGPNFKLGITDLDKTIQGVKGPEQIIGMKGRTFVITKTVDGKLWKKDALQVATILGKVFTDDERRYMSI